MIVNVITTLASDDVEYDIKGEVEYHMERDYGADADGNRGVDTIQVDRVEIVYIKNENGEVSTPELRGQAERKIRESFYDGGW
jgi:hypothetical protein